jgi:hypothetical protein
MPAIAESVFQKIDRAAIFVGDITFVASLTGPNGSNLKGLPNPNVLIELGYAAKAIGWDRIIGVFNDCHGSIADQIFNLKHRRNPVRYDFGPDEADEKAQRDRLSDALEAAIRSVLSAEHLAADGILARLDPYAQTFLRMHASMDRITPTPTNVFTLGAPVNNLDTPSYNAAVTLLRQLGVIRAIPDPTTHSIAFRWTPMGYLVLRKLGLRQSNLDLPAAAKG